MKTDDALRHFGGKRALAQALGLTRQAIEYWGEFVAEGQAYKLMALTNGKLKVIAAAYLKRRKTK